MSNPTGSREEKSPAERPSEAESLRLAFDNLPMGIGLINLDGIMLIANPFFRKLYGLEGPPPEALQGLPPENITIWDAIDAGMFDELVDDPKAVFTHVFETLGRGEELSTILEVGGRIIELHDKPLPGGLILSTQMDVTDRVTAERRVEHLANHDPLTGLANRAAFNLKLSDVFEEARATKTPFALISVDLDHFKDVNDVFGHGAGDKLLQEVARRFKAVMQDCFAARLGGDEFIFVCEGGPQPEKAGQLVERLMQEVAGEVEFEANHLLVNFSAGIAVYPDDGDDIETLLSGADAALYRAKEEGRGNFKFFEPEMDRRIHNRRKLAQDLRMALKRGEFSLHYQPQATVEGQITGFEALLRWDHPQFGPMPPESFIPIAEDNGLIVDIGAWVLEEACKEAKSWDYDHVISVNISPVQFRHGDLPRLVHRILFQTGLKPGRLELEVTEGALVHDFPRALSSLRRIKALGVRIAMDDFGTGYSSLSYLRAFPFDKLKIDKSFIGRLGQDPHAGEIVRAVIGLGRGLNLPIVAEGVETEEQRQFLENEHCYGIQGWLLGRPQSHPDKAAVIGKKPKPETGSQPLSSKSRRA